MTINQRVLAYLQSIAPQHATNSDIRHNVGTRHHQQLFQATQSLLRAGAICGQRIGHEWEFWVEISSANRPELHESVPPLSRQVPPSGVMTSAHFEVLAQEVMSRHYGVPLHKGMVPGVRKQFDFLSADRQIVGDAKYFSLVGGERLPPAKFSVIAEHVWLLEKTGVRCRFLVFGNDVRVPEQWLARYGNLVSDVQFYFLNNSGELCQLTQ